MSSEINDRSITVLAIEDDPAIRRLLQAAFADSDFNLIEANSASEGIDAVAKKRPDLVLLDLSLPDSSGIRVIETVRGWSSVPILVISGLGAEERKVEALGAGADDYITKPFGISELMARMKVALRHASASSENSENSVFEAGDLVLNFSSRQVFVRGELVVLTPIEYSLLSVLAKNAGKVLTHRQLLTLVWGPEYAEEGQYLRVYIGSLRRKVEAEVNRPSLIINEPRVGYRLVN